MSVKPAALLKSRNFAPLFWTQFLGAFNDNVLKNALVILLTYRGIHLFGVPPAQMVALAGGIFILPFFLFSATAGQLADTYDKAKIAQAVKLVEIVIAAIVGLGFWFETFELLLFALFLFGAHSTVFGPVKYSLLPEHLHESQLVAGNAWIEAGTFLAILIGTLLGGVVSDSPTVAALIVFGTAVLGWLASRSIPPAPPRAHLSIRWNPIKPTIEILKSAYSIRSIWLSILGISWFWFFGSAFLSLLPDFAKTTLHSPAWVVTAFLTCFSIGVGLGSALCSKLSAGQLELGLVPLGSFGLSLFSLHLGLAFDRGLGWIMTDLVLVATFGGLFIVPLFALIQERSPPAERSRTIAANNIINAAFMVIAALMLVGLQSMGLEAPQIFVILAALNFLVAVYIYTLLPEFLFRLMIWVLARVMYRMRVHGASRIPEHGGAVLVANHVSFVDWMLIGAVSPRPIRFVMDHAFSKGFLTERFLKRGKVILIATSKEDPELKEAAFRQIAQELKDGELVCIFPEGRLTKDGTLGDFRPGIERMIRETPVPVIPIGIRGMWGSWFSREGGRAVKKPPKRFRSRVELRVGDALPAGVVSAAKLREAVTGLLG